jgi:hypothetical protein
MRRGNRGDVDINTNIHDTDDQVEFKIEIDNGGC